MADTEDKAMKKKILIPIIAGVLALSMIAGCASSKNREAGPRNSSSDEMTAGAVSGDYLNKSYEYGYEGEDWDMNDGVTTLSAAGEVSGEINNEVTVDPEQGRLLIRTVSMSAETTEFDSLRADLEAQVKQLGGYIENSSMSGTGNNRNLRTAYYTVRVPADQLDGLIDKVGNSCTIISSSETTTDVTLDYVDTKSRVESLRVEYDQLLELLDEAEDLDTIITLQNRLTDVRYEIESNESWLRVLENQVCYATLNLTLTEVLEETEVEEPHIETYPEKVQKQFQDTWDRTVEFFQNLLLGLIASIPGLVFLAVLGVIGLIIFLSIRRKVRKRRAKALAMKEAEKKEAEKKETENKETEKALQETKEEGKE